MRELICSFTAARITQYRPSKNPGHRLAVGMTNTCACNHIATVRILAPFLRGGGPKGILFSLFWNKKASFKGIYTLNGVHKRVFSIQKV